MKILITGGNGLVGGYLSEVLREGNDVYAPGRQDMDITDREKVIRSIRDFKPSVVIHCAAFTDVDGCEVDKEKAYRVNAFGTQYVAEGCAGANCTMVHLSTDFVFDGKKKTPYLETDQPNPLSVYAETKLLGEYYVSHILRRFVIVRPSRIFGRGGRNFASRIPELMKHKGNKITITRDIVNSPTYASDLVNAIRFLVQKQFYGIVNICDRGECSWYEYGLKVKEFLKVKDVELIPVSFSDFEDKKAERPHYSALSTQLLESLGFIMPDWQDSLRRWLES
jgi:dTDP-4-dehydrorhamnose reductase